MEANTPKIQIITILRRSQNSAQVARPDSTKVRGSSHEKNSYSLPSLPFPVYLFPFPLIFSPQPFFFACGFRRQTSSTLFLSPPAFTDIAIQSNSPIRVLPLYYYSTLTPTTHNHNHQPPTSSSDPRGQLLHWPTITRSLPTIQPRPYEHPLHSITQSRPPSIPSYIAEPWRKTRSTQNDRRSPTPKYQHATTETSRRKTRRSKQPPPARPPTDPLGLANAMPHARLTSPPHPQPLLPTRTRTRSSTRPAPARG